MSHSFLALVLLENPATPDMLAVAKALRARHPELATEVADDRVMAAEQGHTDSPLIRCGNELVAVMPMPGPVPNDPGLWARAARAWPDSKAVAGRHRGHLIVSMLGQNRRPLAAARSMTAVIGALIATMPECRGVVWDGKVAGSAERWLDESRRSFAPFPDYPFTLWIDIAPFRSGMKIGAITTGLSAFVGREIEFTTGKLTVPALIDRVAGLAAYLVEHGNVIRDGDTVGQDENERFAVRYGNSDAFGGLPVFSCTEEPA